VKEVTEAILFSSRSLIDERKVCERQTDKQTNRQTDKHRHTDRETNKQTDRKTHRHIDTQTEKQTNRHTHRQTDTWTRRIGLIRHAGCSHRCRRAARPAKVPFAMKLMLLKSRNLAGSQ
jgi:hypothetical protein